MNRGELKDEINMITGRRDLEPNVDEWVEHIRRKVATRVDLPYSEYYATYSSTSTVAGTQNYPLPSGYLRHLMMFLGDKKLIEIDFKHWSQKYAASETSDESQGEPTYFVIRPSKTYDLHPIPDAVYTINLEYYKIPTAFTADTDTDGLLTDYPELVMWGVALRAATFMRDSGLGQIAAQEFDKEYDRLYRYLKLQNAGDKTPRMKSHADFSVAELRRRMGMFS